MPGVFSRRALELPKKSPKMRTPEPFLLKHAENRLIGNPSEEPSPRNSNEEICPGGKRRQYC